MVFSARVTAHDIRGRKGASTWVKLRHPADELPDRFPRDPHHLRRGRAIRAGLLEPFPATTVYSK